MGQMLVRWLFSFAAACYIVAALALVPEWIRAQRLSIAAEWIAYLAAEALALGALVLFSLWLLFARAGEENEPFHPARFVRLTITVLAPLFALLVVPVGCFVLIQGAAGTIAGAGIFAFSLGALLIASFTARRPRE
jgi:hypothetical protein